MKSSLEDQSFHSRIPNSFPSDVFPPISNTNMIGIVSSPPSLENVQFLPVVEEKKQTLGVFEQVSDPTQINCQQTNFTHTFLKSILTSIDSKDPVVANAWLETLLDVIDLLPKEFVREEILSLTVSKGQSQHIPSRLASCKLIGKISTKFEPYILKSEIAGIVQSLCQDVSGEVRGSMCTQLAAVAKGVGLNTTKSLILPELVDLCSDEEVTVRLAGINTVVQMLPLVDQDTRSNTLVPLVRKICERALKVEDITLPVTTHHLGRICHGLHDDLAEEVKDWFIKFYCTLAKLGLPDAKKTDIGLPMPDLVAEVRSGEYEAECRQQCAYNLPAMIVFAGGPPGYRKHLHDALLSFATDPSLQVRNTLSLAFHQICTLVGSEVGILRDSFLNLLRSENLEVIAAIVPNISHILAAFNHHQVITYSSQQTDVLELVGAIKQGEESIGESSNWRAHSEILRQIAALALCLPPDLIFSEVVPLMIFRMHTVRPIPCRQAAARTLLVFLRHMESTEQRDHIYNTLVIEFSEGKSCHKRMLFLSICQMALELLPLKLFKYHLYSPILALQTDPVPNIRLKLIFLLPILKGILTLPEDRQRLQELETLVGNLLMRETDKDVSAAIANVISELDKIEVTEGQKDAPPEDHQVPGTTRDRTQLPRQHLQEGKYDNDAVAGNESGSGDSPKKTLGGGCALPRRNNVGGRIPSYVAAERRRSSTFAPEVPPDEVAVKRGFWIKDCVSDADLSVLCDEVLLSPEEPPSINWDDPPNANGNFSPNQSERRRIGTPPFASMERLSLSGERERKGYREKAWERDLRDLVIKERLLNNEENNSFKDTQYATNKNAPHVQKLEAQSTFFGQKYSSSTPSKSVQDMGDLTTRQRFWMRSSRTRWRRRVASADTSPEEPRRAKFNRGNSMDSGRTCFSDTEDPDSHYMFDEQLCAPAQETPKPSTGAVPNLTPSSVSSPANNEGFDEPSPPSPHGMYTWPPQHTRHKHHTLPGEEENTNVGMRHESPQKDSLSTIYKNEDYHSQPLPTSNYSTDSVNSGCSSTSSGIFSPNHRKFSTHVKDTLSKMYNDTKRELPLSAIYAKSDNSNSFVPGSPQQWFSVHPNISREKIDSMEGNGMSFEASPWTHSSSSAPSFRQDSRSPPPPLHSLKTPVIPDPFNYHPHSVRSSKNSSAANKDAGFSPFVSFGTVCKDTLSLLLSATPKASSKVYDEDLSSRHIPPSYRERNVSVEDEEDLYAVHGIHPTIPRRGVSTSSPPSPRPLPTPPIQRHPEGSGHFPDMYEEEYFPHPYSHSFPDASEHPYKEVRYHLAAAALAAEREWHESRRGYEPSKPGPRLLPRPRYGTPPPPSYVLLDSAELAPWSPSAAAYPIGPLGASWLQRHGFPSPARHPAYFYPPPRFIARPAWPPPHTHIPSFRSVSAIDPAADEFLVDAGVRFDPDTLRSSRPRLPPPPPPHARSRLLAPSPSLGGRVGHPLGGSTPPPRASKIPVVGRTSESGLPMQGVSPVETRPRLGERPPGRPISGLGPASTGRTVSIGGSRGKSLSHENLRPGGALPPRGMGSSSAKTSPVSSRPASPSGSHPSSRRGAGVGSARVPGIGVGMARSKAPSAAVAPAEPTGCISPTTGDRRASASSASPASSRGSSPGRGDDSGMKAPGRPAPLTRANSSVGVPGGSARTRQGASIQSIGGANRGGRGSKLPLPTSRK